MSEDTRAKDSGSAATASATAVRLTPDALLREMGRVSEKIASGTRRLAKISDEQLEIATTPKDEVWRQDMVRLYRYRPLVDRPVGVPVGWKRRSRLQRTPSVKLGVDRCGVQRCINTAPPFRTGTARGTTPSGSTSGRICAPPFPPLCCR